MKIQIINGPNLNLLGKREKAIYGEMTFETFVEQLKKRFSSVSIDFFQSNIEGEMIEKLHEAGFSYDGIILNAGAYTHTSVGLHDALRAISTPSIEVHISNIYAREAFRHQSITASECLGLISGFGLEGYAMAIQYFTHNAKIKGSTVI